MFDRERVFVDTALSRIVRDFPALKLVLEHITTREAAQFVAAAPANVGATITPQHLLWSRNALFAGGMRPHLYCLPVLKRETHRRALVARGDRRQSRSFSSAPIRRRTRRRAKESGLRLRRLLFRARGDRALRRSVRGRRRARPARSASRVSTAPTSTACRATPTRSRCEREPWTVPAELSVRRARRRAAARRRSACAGASP